MTLAVFLMGVIISMILDRQAKRHENILKDACRRFGVELPAPTPKLPMLESLLNLSMGLVITIASAAFILVSLLNLHEPMTRQVGEGAAATMGIGLAMVILGAKGSLAQLRYRKLMRQNSA